VVRLSLDEFLTEARFCHRQPQLLAAELFAHVSAEVGGHGLAEVNVEA
jgi:hypothetical protein